MITSCAKIEFLHDDFRVFLKKLNRILNLKSGKNLDYPSGLTERNLFSEMYTTYVLHTNFFYFHVRKKLIFECGINAMHSCAEGRDLESFCGIRYFRNRVKFWRFSSNDRKK